MIPLHLITGFLGSGKTTFLLDTARRFANRRLVFLVNEFSHHSVDHSSLQSMGWEAIPVPGGSIFCRCLITEFLHHLRAIASSLPSSERPLDALVVEASGISDPRSAERLLQESGLDAIYELSSVICLIDPGSFVKLLPGLPNISAQVESADLILINKTDLFPESEIATTEEKLLEINSRCPILRTHHGTSAWSPFQNIHRKSLGGEYSPCRDPHYAVTTFKVGEAVAMAELKSFVAEFPGEIYRLKGFLRHSGRTQSIDYSLSHWNCQEAETYDLASSLVLIFHKQAEDRIQERLEQLGWMDFAPI